MGSENGTPSSITSAPPASIDSMTSGVISDLGKPAVTNDTNAGMPCVQARYTERSAFHVLLLSISSHA